MDLPRRKLASWTEQIAVLKEEESSNGRFLDVLSGHLRSTQEYITTTELCLRRLDEDIARANDRIDELRKELRTAQGRDGEIIVIDDDDEPR